MLQNKLYKNVWIFHNRWYNIIFELILVKIASMFFYQFIYIDELRNL